DDLAARYHPTVALVSHAARALIARIRADSTWSVLDVDGSAVLFARDTPGHRAAIAESAERLGRLDAPVAVTDEAIAPRPRPSALVALLGARRFPFERWGRGNGFTLLGMLHAARREYRRALLAA